MLFHLLWESKLFFLSVEILVAQVICLFVKAVRILVFIYIQKWYYGAVNYTVS